MDPRTLDPRASIAPIALDEPKAFHVKNWNRWSEERKVAFIKSAGEAGGRDPRIRKLAVDIIRQAGVQPRDYQGQAQALLRWVQNPKNLYYVNERDEVLQDPAYTLFVARMGDCDDLAMVLGAFFEAIRLDWRTVLSGVDRQGVKHRWVQGTKRPRGVQWSHIYTAVGWPPFRPTTWAFAEPTIQNAPLGWDVVAHAQQNGGQTGLPELGGVIPLTAGAGGIIAAEVVEQDESTFDWKQIGRAVATGVAVTVISTVIIDWIETTRAAR